MAGATVHIHCRRVDFEKWHALGNDYLIVERRALPFELTAARVRALCAPHTGVFADGVLLLSEPDEPGFVARLRIFNPDGSEAELSGNGAREAALVPAPLGVGGQRQLLDSDRGRRDPADDHLADHVQSRARSGAAAERRLPVGIERRVGRAVGRWS